MTGWDPDRPDIGSRDPGLFSVLEIVWLALFAGIRPEGMALTVHTRPLDVVRTMYEPTKKSIQRHGDRSRARRREKDLPW